VLIFLSGGNLFTGSISQVSKSFSPGIATESLALADSGFYPSPSTGFAPDVLERKIVKSTSIATEIDRGSFKESESKVLDIISNSDSILLNQNVNRYGKDKKSYFTGRYTIKVDTTKYDSVISQLKDIGEVTSFNEGQDDVTGRFEDLNIELEAEKEKLARFQQLFDEGADVEFKIQLTDRIFNQERRIKYLEDSLENIDIRVDYSTISLTLNEERSDYANIVFVKFSELVKSFVGSINLLFKFFFTIIPWVIAFFAIKFIWRLLRRR